MLETEVEGISHIRIILVILIAAILSRSIFGAWAYTKHFPYIITGLSQWPYENYMISTPISWIRKLRFGEVNVPSAKAETWYFRLAV